MVLSCRFHAPENGVFLVWEITQRCNLQCLHCCTNSGPLASIVDHTPTENALEVCRALADAGVIRVMFSGGEPLLRPDLVQLVDEIDTDRVETYAATNGMLLTKPLIAGLQRAGLRGVDVSVDGHTEKLHSAIRGPSAGLYRTLDGIRACIAENMPVRVSSVLTPDNCAHLEELLILVAKVGVRSMVIHTVEVNAGRAVLHPELQVEGQLLNGIGERVAELAKKYSGIVDIEFRGLNFQGHWTGCPAGRRILHIAANGDVSPCSWLYKADRCRFRVGNVRTEHFSEIIRKATSVSHTVQPNGQGCPLPLVTLSHVSRI